ncbi:MAG: hypothetical protein ABR589_08855 [Chthoniobacterales bacterium]
MAKFTGWLKAVPRLVWVIIPVALLLGFYLGSAFRVSAEHAAPGNEQQTMPALPGLTILLLAAIVASILLAVFIHLSEKRLGWSSGQVAIVGGVIAIVFITLICGSFYLSDQRPSTEAIFLVCATVLTISLLVIGICYLPKLISEIRASQSIFLKITALLCFAGAGGGLAFHLASHNGDLIMPWLGTVYEGVQRPGQKSDAALTAASPSPSPAREAADQPEKVKRRAFHIGFLGDILLGIIAANALHLALANLVKYDATGEDRRNQYFTFLALGILAGFGGANALSSWADKLTGKEVEQILRESQAQSGQAVNLPQASEASKAVTACLGRFEWPNEAELALMKSFAVARKEAGKPLDRFSINELIAAAGSDVFTGDSVETSEAKPYLARILERPNASKSDRWTARMLRAFLITCQGTSSKKVGWYKEAKEDLAKLKDDTADSAEQANARIMLSAFAASAAKIGGEEIPKSELDATGIDLGAAAGDPKEEKVSVALQIAWRVLAEANGQEIKSLPGIGASQLPLLRLVKAMNAAYEQTINDLSRSALAQPVPSPTPTTPALTPARTPGESPSPSPIPSPSPLGDEE